MKVLELFSGIGGMHFAFKESEINFEVVAALDINTTANAVYVHNFPETKLMQNNVQCLTEDILNRLQIEMISMSPPCQPYTRVGLKKGSEDNRSTALKHVLDLIPKLTRLRFIILENVVGFESSSTRNDLTSVLNGSGFKYHEFILNPTQFYIPNSRSRYYLLAKKRSDLFSFAEKEVIHYNIPSMTDENTLKLLNKYQTNNERCFAVQQILDHTPGSLVPDKVLEKYAYILDIVTEESERTCCFTKGYTHYAEGTGSVFCPKPREKINDVYRSIKNINHSDKEYVEMLKTLEMRYFSPVEVARLMCFPENFSFPEMLSEKQKYRLLGNSINVHVVSVLIKILVE